MATSECSRRALPPHVCKTDGTLCTPVLPTFVVSVPYKGFTRFPRERQGATLSPRLRHTSCVYYFSATAAREFDLEVSNLVLEGLKCVSVFFTYVFLNVFSEHDQWVVVLFHTTLGTLDARFEPTGDALDMKRVFTSKTFEVIFLDVIKTHSTCLGKVCTTLAVFDRFLSALCSIQCQCRAIHVL